MITKWRLEALDDNRESVEEQLESAEQSMLGHLRDHQPEDQWELTDEVLLPVIVKDEAQIYGRRVFSRNKGGS